MIVILKDAACKIDGIFVHTTLLWERSAIQQVVVDEECADHHGTHPMPHTATPVC